MEFISKYKYWLIAGLLGIALSFGLWYFLVGSKNDPTKGRKPYFSANTYNMLTSGTLSGEILNKYKVPSTSTIKPWRELAGSEYGSVYGTWAWEFGYDMHFPPKGKPSFDQVMQWYKVMNLDPWSLQGYACLFIDDIIFYSQNAKQYSYPFNEIKAGAAYA